MKIRYAAGIALCLTALFTAAAFGQILDRPLNAVPKAKPSAPLSKAEERMKSEAAQLSKHARRTSEVCGTAITAKFDWKNVPAKDLSKFSPSGYCNAALEGIEQVCGEQIGKDAVKAQIKSVICSFADSRQIALKDGLLTYKINFSSSNDMSFVYESLENRL